jgi:glutaredoxin
MKNKAAANVIIQASIISVWMRISFSILSPVSCILLLYIIAFPFKTLDKHFRFVNNEIYPMKITVYTVTDCQFSKQEKDYLNTNKFAFDEKNLETNREFLTEMLAVSNNFAGTPVTKIEKDDGQIVVLKGFTKEEFDKTLGLGEKPAPVEAAPPPEVPAAKAPVVPDAPAATPPPVVPEPVAPAPVVAAAPQPEPVQSPPEPVMPPPVAPAAPPETPAAPATPDPMANILNNLQQQANSAPSASNGMPSIPDPKL